MADMIEINLAVLKRDMEELKSELSGVKMDIKQAFAEVQALDAMWDGPANSEFNRIFKSDYNYMMDLLHTFDDLVQYMEKAGDEYLYCEAAVSQAIDEIRV